MASKYIINSTTLTSLANATRSLVDKTNSFTPAQMISEINNYRQEQAYIPPAQYYNNTTITAINNYKVSIVGTNAFRGCTKLSNVILSSCNYVDAYAFTGCTSLKSVYIGGYGSVYIGPEAFYSCTSLERFECSKATTFSCFGLYDNAFYGCTSLKIISLPLVTSINDSFFNNLDGNVKNKVTTITMYNLTSIFSNMFSNFTALNTIAFNNCTRIGSSAFYTCTALKTILFSKCTQIFNNAFENCSSLTTVGFSECNEIRNSAFKNCSRLTNLTFPKCTNIYANAFQSCTALTSASFPKCMQIYANAFQGCRSLSYLYLNQVTRVPNLVSVDAFDNTPLSAGGRGTIYVPNSLLASFKTTRNWSLISARLSGR